MRSTNAISLGRFGGISLAAEPSTLIGSLLLWVVLSVAGLLILNFSLVTALLAGVGGVLLHWVAVILHQAGHALAAYRAGYPMVGIRLWWVLSSSVYPPDEPALPTSVHVQRAIGGPIGSLLFGAIFALPLLVIPYGTVAWWLALFFCLEHLLTFSIGSLLPLGFTDGSTLLQLYGKG